MSLSYLDPLLALRDSGIPEDKIKYELFGSSAEDAAERVAKHHARAEAFSGKMCDVTLVNDGRASQVRIAADGENLLDAGLNLLPLIFIAY